MRRAHLLRHLALLGCLALLLTGAAWMALQWAGPQETPFGPQPHPAAAWLLRAHGALAWIVAVAGGAVWQAHMRPAWHHRGPQRRRRASGVAGAGLLATLLLSAIGLQYASESVHPVLSWLHQGAGLALAAALGAHALARRRR